MLNNIKSDDVLKIIMKLYLNQKKNYILIKHNKNIQKRIELSLKDYQEYYEKILETKRLEVKEFATEAVRCDKLEEYFDAITLYTAAAEALADLIKLDKNPYSIKVYENRRIDYLNRAEYIKKHYIKKNIYKMFNEIEEYSNEAEKYEKLKNYKNAIYFYEKASNLLLDLKNLFDEKQQKFLQRVKELQTINVKEYFIEKNPNIKWDEIAGLNKAKKIIKEVVIFPKNFPELFKNKKKWKTMLLYGPPENGKTLLAKAAVTEIFEKSSFILIPSNFIEINNDKDIIYLIKEIFTKAKEKGSCVILFEEIENIMDTRKDDEDINKRILKSEISVEIKNILTSENDIFIIGTTRHPWELDQNFINIFQRRIYIPLPDFDTRKTLVEINLKNIPNNINDEQIKNLVTIMEGFNCATIEECLKKTYNELIKKYKDTEKDDNNSITPKLNFEDINEAIKSHKAALELDLKKYEEWTAKFGQEGN